MTFFQMMTPRQQWTQENGTPTTEFYRFVFNLFKSAGGAGPTSPITVTASPFLFVTPKASRVIVNAGTVSKIEFSRDGTTFFTTGQTAGLFALSEQDQLRVTYTVAPTMTLVPS